MEQEDLNICLLGSWIKGSFQQEKRLWKQVVHAKYDIYSPNIFCCKEKNSSFFWKGVMKAAHAVKFGYIWVVGKGDRVRFWEDTWFGGAPLGTQYSEIYSVLNEQNITVHEAWDGTQIRCTFRRNFTAEMLEQWRELEAIADSICFTEIEDAVVWKYECNGIYSSSSLYRIVNNRGVLPVFLHVMWKIQVPPKIHIFLWLLAKNKVMTKDNMEKRKMGKPLDCVFCLEQESIEHLFFGCVVAKCVWSDYLSYFRSQLLTSNL